MAAVELTFDGEPLEALPGQSVAAALMASGRDSWRTTRGGGRARGVFCGIGACFDCLVVVNGLPDVRACQRAVSAGDQISTQRGAVLPAGEAQAQASAADGVQVVPVVVVGAGPAGMSAAVAAADAGSSVLLVDAAGSVGGQFNRQLPSEFRAGRPEKLQHGWRAFARLRDRIAADDKITHLTDTNVWAVEQGVRTRLWLQGGAADAAGRRVWAVETSALVLATGAFDRVLPFPGWDLPGVYSAGAAQALAKGQRIAVGRRVVVAGTGPFLLPVAESLVGVGAEVVALLEANRPSTVVKGWLTDPLVASSKLSEAATYATLLARKKIPFKHGRTVVAAHGTDRVEAVTVARLDANWKPIPGTEERLEVDAVCLGFGFTANLELAVSTRCTLGEGPDGGPAVLVDENQQTTTPGVFAAGELTGIGGAALAAAEGQVAGAAASQRAASTTTPSSSTGSPPSATSRVGDEGGASHGSPSQLDQPGEQMQALRRAVAKGKRFAAALAKAYPVRDGWLEWSRAETVVCRCEEVSRGEVEEAVGVRDVVGARSLKLSCRAGLGLCQGRVCGRNVAAISGVSSEHGRPVAQPVRLKDLAVAEILEDL
ncbi:FAD-dependent oxidoreductase [Kribbella catacumbae]|uniref:FAD-dependent oxidoreductase n=1 Tax=Kribbella catacumbae TaxID=460086 RepID=UPI00037489F7|nr:FAD-dependent oxidoreductase [Kribbella catacumbae]